MNQELDFLQGLFGSEEASINWLLFLWQLVLTTILTFLVSFTYVRFGSSLSNRRSLARSFVLVGLTTMIIITIVKSSLALSLGLVGALSIVRFRTAIKEPEELAYFFIVIAIGLGIGAGQVLITVIGTLALCLLAFLNSKNKKTDVQQNLIIRFDRTSQGADIQAVVAILERHTEQLELRRLDETDEVTEVAFVAAFKDFTALLSAKNDLRKQHQMAGISFLELT